MLTTDPQSTLEAVRNRYAKAAQTVFGANSEPCCGGSAAQIDECCGNPVDSATTCCENKVDPITGDLYSSQEIGFVPLDAISASLGCGNPTALAQLNEGDVVLDLGSGGGIDVLLSARRVGPTGHAYGIDMTDEMHALAEKNLAKAGAENVTFLQGRIEDIPLSDASIDVIISNCVINLAVEKPPVLREAYRVLRPGGRFAVSDVVTRGALPDDLRHDMEAWIGCIAGALEESEFRAMLSEAGFEDIEIQETRVYDPRDLAETARGGEQACCASRGNSDVPNRWDGSSWERFEQSGGQVISAFVRARKPE